MSRTMLCVFAKNLGFMVQVDADIDDADNVASEGGSGDEVGAAVSRAAARKKTRVDRNRERRRRDAEVRDTMRKKQACTGFAFVIRSHATVCLVRQGDDLEADQVN